jgi:hypothetical protein
VLREAGDDLAREERRRRLVPVGFGRSSGPVPTRPASSHLVSRPVVNRPPMARPVAGVAPITPSRPPERMPSASAGPVARMQASVVVAA